MNAPIKSKIEVGRPAHPYDRAKKGSPYRYCIIWENDDEPTLCRDPLAAISEDARVCDVIIQVKRVGREVELLDVTQAIISEYNERELSGDDERQSHEWSREKIRRHYEVM